MGEPAKRGSGGREATQGCTREAQGFASLGGGQVEPGGVDAGANRSVVGTGR